MKSFGNKSQLDYEAIYSGFIKLPSQTIKTHQRKTDYHVALTSLVMIRKHTFIIYEMINESKQVFIIVLIKETIVICYAITKQLIRKRVRHD